MVANLNDPKTKKAWIVAQAKCHSCKFLCRQMLVKNAVEWQTLPCGNSHARLVVKEDESVECDSYEKSDKGADDGK